MARQTPAELKPACTLVSLKYILEMKTSYAARLRCLSALSEVFFWEGAATLCLLVQRVGTSWRLTPFA